MIPDTNLPAFPTEPNMQPGFFQHHGMSLRDYFAIHAINGLYAGRRGDLQLGAKDLLADAEIAYRVADAMLEARIKEQANGR